MNLPTLTHYLADLESAYNVNEQAENLFIALDGLAAWPSLGDRAGELATVAYSLTSRWPAFDRVANTYSRAADTLNEELPNDDGRELALQERTQLSRDLLVAVHSARLAIAMTEPGL